jgi:hypothetical protein
MCTSFNIWIIIYPILFLRALLLFRLLFPVYEKVKIDKCQYSAAYLKFVGGILFLQPLFHSVNTQT